MTMMLSSRLLVSPLNLGMYAVSPLPICLNVVPRSVCVPSPPTTTTIPPLFSPRLQHSPSLALAGEGSWPQLVWVHVPSHFSWRLYIDLCVMTACAAVAVGSALQKK
eukprot:RCo026884